MYFLAHVNLFKNRRMTFESNTKEKVLERELKSLQKTGDHYPKYLITMDMDLTADYEGITKVNVIDWLLDCN